MSETKNKKALADVLAAKMDMKKKDALTAVDVIFDEIKDVLKDGGTVDVSGFGKFIVKHKDERMGINPATGASVTIPAKNVPAFKPSKAFKDSL